MKKIFKACSIILAIIMMLTVNISAQDLNKEFHKGRRAELIKKMGEGILILSAGKSQIPRNSDAPFKQEDNFWYLTGYKSPDAILLITPKAVNKTALFVPKAMSFNRETRKVEQKDISFDAIAKYGVDTAYSLEDFEKVFIRYAANENKIYCSRMDKNLTDITSKYVKNNPDKTITDPLEPLSELRIIKTPEEIEFIQKAADITTEAQMEAMKASKPGVNERTLDAIIGFVYRMRWASGFGFESIVGSGPNSLIPHYFANDRKMEDGDVCVMDLGAAYNGYSADITRTMPINGKFTKEQKDIYEAVLKSQKEAIKLFKPGTMPKEIEDKAADVAKEELLRLGLITDKNTAWQFRTWYLHGVSHSIGLDVHDATPNSYYKEGQKPGMIFTIEPGIYINEAALDQMKSRNPNKEILEFIEKVRPMAKKYNNIGVRIEDDILITRDGYKVITSACPKEVNDIEKLMKQKSRFAE